MLLTKEDVKILDKNVRLQNLIATKQNETVLKRCKIFENLNLKRRN